MGQEDEAGGRIVRLLAWGVRVIYVRIRWRHKHGTECFWQGRKERARLYELPVL